MNHGWLVRMLEQRVEDRAFIGLIRKWLKAGVLEAGEENPLMPDAGTPQGGVISPVLANIYLHFVLDRWIENVVKANSKGEVIFMRYADDIIVCFERQDDAQRYMHNLGGRLAKFSLRLAEEKTGLVKFNRWESDSREIYVPRLRLLLGADDTQPQAQDGEAADEQEEIPGCASQDERVDKRGEELAAEDGPQ